MALLRAVADLLFPPVCQACREPGEYPLCITCRSRIQLIAPPVCQKCGRPLSGLPDHVFTCATCRYRTLHFSRARSAGVYEGSLREAIHALKFARCRAIAGPLATLMVPPARDLMPLEMVVPVPLHPARYRERGFNQSELLAQEVARALRLPLDSRVLRRVRPTAAQSELGVPHRRANVRAAFEWRQRIDGARVLLVDDVLSTGFTTSECALALQAGGAAEVRVLTAAQAVME